MVIVFLARLQTLPPDQRDAARVDGAGPAQEFRYITLPWLKPVIIIAMLLRTIWLFNEFDLVYLLGYGGPLGSTTTLPVLIRHLAFDVQSYGQACALAMSMAAILVVASWVYFRVYARAEEALQ
jgi:multiple sugar transport system permease protein